MKKRQVLVIVCALTFASCTPTFAHFTDPWGTYIEVTESLAR
jgi:hypothetical protein